MRGSQFNAMVDLMIVCKLANYGFVDKMATRTSLPSPVVRRAELFPWSTFSAPCQGSFPPLPTPDGQFEHFHDGGPIASQLCADLATVHRRDRHQSL